MAVYYQYFQYSTLIYMTTRQKKIISYLSFEGLLIVILISNIILTFECFESIRLIARIVKCVLITLFLSFIIFLPNDFHVCSSSKIYKVRKYIYALSWALIALTIISRLNILPYFRIWVIIAMIPTSLHFILELILYFKGDLKIE